MLLDQLHPIPALHCLRVHVLVVFRPFIDLGGLAVVRVVVVPVEPRLAIGLAVAIAPGQSLQRFSVWPLLHRLALDSLFGRQGDGSFELYVRVEVTGQLEAAKFDGWNGIFN